MTLPEAVLIAAVIGAFSSMLGVALGPMFGHMWNRLLKAKGRDESRPD